MSRNFWTCTENDYKNKILSDIAVDGCDKLADYFLNNILEKVQSEDHPNSKQVNKNTQNVSFVHCTQVHILYLCIFNNNKNDFHISTKLKYKRYN